jgi:hypothetical protein
VLVPVRWNVNVAFCIAFVPIREMSCVSSPATRSQPSRARARRPLQRGRVWALGGLAAAFGLGFALGGTLEAGLTSCCGVAACGSSSCTTSPTASTRSATCSVAAGSLPRTSRATCLALAVLVRRVMAQQPPHVPHVGAARAGPLRARPVCASHPRPCGLRARVGRRRREPRAPGAQAPAPRSPASGLTHPLGRVARPGPDPGGC